MFTMVSLDGYFEGLNHELDWHHVDAEFHDFAAAQLRAADLLLFGRKTYELMARYWPTEIARQRDPQIAALMNAKPKLVVSTTMGAAGWQNTRLMGDLQALKAQPGGEVLVLGSNQLSVALIEMGLLDEVRLMVAPVAIGQGHSLFTGLSRRLKAQLAESRPFSSGNLLLTYQVRP